MECVIFYWHRCTREYLLQLCSLYAKILLEGKAQGAEHDLLEQKKICGDNGDISNGMIYQFLEMRQMLRFSGSDHVLRLTF